MQLVFKAIRDFDKGILYRLLDDAYSFGPAWQAQFSAQWEEFEDFFFGNAVVADTCGFITTLDNEPIGFVTWDPRGKPDYMQVGHNCLLTKHKGRGYGKKQLQEAVNRITQHGVAKIIVTTNEQLVAAQHMYESVGFKVRQRRANDSESAFSGDYIDYEMKLK